MSLFGGRWFLRGVLWSGASVGSCVNQVGCGPRFLVPRHSPDFLIIIFEPDLAIRKTDGSVSPDQLFSVLAAFEQEDDFRVGPLCPHISKQSTIHYLSVFLAIAIERLRQKAKLPSPIRFHVRRKLAGQLPHLGQPSPRGRG